jgi:hypothetical protein
LSFFGFSFRLAHPEHPVHEIKNDHQKLIPDKVKIKFDVNKNIEIKTQLKAIRFLLLIFSD